ncbi:hypothetical protein BC834DRAFT_900279 [Gloeopeniophorella convolvens]|nr:hypothetical protein BC834DRAFT_900279 [Gloeopeniophorella convolvens]
MIILLLGGILLAINSRGGLARELRQAAPEDRVWLGSRRMFTQTCKKERTHPDRKHRYHSYSRARLSRAPPRSCA